MSTLPCPMTPTTLPVPLPRMVARQTPSGFLRALWHGLRAMLLLPGAPERVPAHAGHLAGLMLLSALLTLLGDRVLLGPTASEFNWMALRGFWADVPVNVLCSIWITSAVAQATAPGCGEGPIMVVPPPLHLACLLAGAQVWLVALTYGCAWAIDQGLASQIPLGPLAHLTLEDVAQPLYDLVVVWPLFVAGAVLVRMRHSSTPPRRHAWLVLPLLAGSATLSLLVPQEAFWLQAASPDAPPAQVAPDHKTQYRI